MAAPMYRLETFGKLVLSGGTTKLSHQRRRLALLALLSSSGDQGLSRDQLLAYLWSASSATSGRHSLEQLLYAMRRALGEGVFVGVNPVRLDPAIIGSDVNDFERAVSRGEWGEAVAMYRGPFLDGFYLDDAPEFERWSEAERARLAQRYAEALTHLADAAEGAGDHATTIRWRRRLVEADPVGSRSALGLMRALVASGDRTAAIQHARIYEALVRQELESEPDPSITKYVAALRSGSPDAQTHAPLRAAAPEPLMPTVPAPGNGVLPPALPAPVVAVAPPSAAAPAIPARGSRARWMAAVAGAAMIALLAALAMRNRQVTPALDANRIVIVPFRTSGADSSVKYLGEGVVDLLAPMLTGEGGPVAVDSRTAISTWNRVTRDHEGTADDARQVARELGAGLALTGSIVEVNGSLTITGNVISGDDAKARALTSVTAPGDSVDTLLDRFVGQLLVHQSGASETSIAAITSQSLPAIRAYLGGRAAYRNADEDLAIERFTRALEIDSTFALAALDLAIATGKLLRTRLCVDNACRVYSIMPGLVLLSDRVDDQFDRAVSLAWANKSRLGRRDRPLLDALHGENFPSESSSRRTLVNLRRAVGAAPDRPEAHYLLGIFLLYQGPALGLTDARAQAEAGFRAASRLDSSYLAPLARMVDVAAFDGDTAKVRQAGALYLERDSAGARADYVRWMVSVATGDIAGQRAIRERFRSLDRATLQQIYLNSQMSGFGLEDADTAAMLIIDGTADRVDKSVALRRAQLLALNRGRPHEATQYLRRRQEMATTDHQFRNFTILAALFDDGDPIVADSSALVAARSLARDTIGPLTPDGLTRAIEAMVTHAQWSLARGDTAPALAAVQWLHRNSGNQPRSRALSVLPEMMIASRAKRPEGAELRALVDSIALEGCCELSPFGSLVLARAYEDAGDTAAALRVIRRGLWLFPPRATARHRREEGRLAAQLGDAAGAIRAYEHYLALRSDPEPALRMERDRIQAELDRLRRRRADVR